jgi:hypothetical protein
MDPGTKYWFRDHAVPMAQAGILNAWRAAVGAFAMGTVARQQAPTK